MNELDAKVQAAFITAIGAVVVAIVGAAIAWWRTRAAINLKARLDLNAEGYSHTLTKQLERLKAEFQLELTNVEVREQLRATLRLRMFEDDERRVSEAMQVFRECYSSASHAVLLLAQASTSTQGLDEARKLSSHLLCRGLLLPKRVLDPVRKVEDEIRTLAGLDPTKTTTGQFSVQQGKIHDAMEELEEVAAAWRDENINNLLGAPLAQPPKTS